jgi:hypothetical protein
MARRWSSATVTPWRPWQSSLPPSHRRATSFSSSSGVVLNTAPLALFGGALNVGEMYSGTLINDLFAVVERAETFARLRHVRHADPRSPEPPSNACHCKTERSESEQFPQALRLSPADWNLGLLLVVHAQLVGALEPGNDFANAVDVHQVGAVRPPKKIRV